MHTKIISKRESSRAVIDSLFTAGGTLACLPVMRYDQGKYRHDLTGMDLPTPSEFPVWTERRKDSNGPYWIINTFDADTRDGRIVIHPGTMAERALEQTA